jgi:DNA repair protein RadC
MNYPSPTLHLLPVRERPACRVSENADECNLVELLAAVVRGPRQIEIAFALLGRFGDLDALSLASVCELTQVQGVGSATAASIKAALELGRRRLLAASEDRFAVRSPADAAQFLMAEMAGLEQEHFKVLYLDTRNRLLGNDTLYVGSLNASHIRVAEVFREATRRNCASIVCAHNHPSSDPTPSPEDVEVTRQIVAAGALLNIECLDHLVIGRGRYVSLRERGLGFS